MRDADVAGVQRLSVATFEDLARRRGETPPPPPDPELAAVRLRRLLTTDPGGCWIADDADGGLAGAALAIVREGLWGLSLFIVRPDRQSEGLGGRLLRRALAHGDGWEAGIILASPDPRALRTYRRAGFDLHPTVTAAGVPAGVAAAPEVRPFAPEDTAMADEVGRQVRGAAYGDDLAALAAGGCELLAHPGRGFLATRAGRLILLVAADEAAAAALLRTMFARAGAGAAVEVEWLTERQGWALDVALDAGLELQLGHGALFVRGDPGPLAPYVPSGAYL